MSKEEKKGYYLHFQGRTSVGVSKKIDMQMEEFRKHYDMQEIEIETFPRSFLQRVIGLLPTKSIARGYTKALKQMSEPDFVYIRRTVADKLYTQFMCDIKRKFPQCKIIIEIFTYPYDMDNFGKWNAWPFYIKERIYRPKLKKYVDRFVTYTKDREIFGVPTLCTINGINLEGNKLVGGEYHSGLIRLLGVAYMQRQHGFERVILGLADYYNKKQDYSKCRIELWLVGDGPEKSKYMNLVQKHGMEEYVTFFPNTTGDELNQLYDQCDMALIAFGAYKVHFSGKTSALKSRECLAKGMPLISGSPIDVLDDEFEYALICSNDDTPLCMEDIISFYRRITENRSKKQVAQNIRSQTENLIDIAATMAPIFEYIEDETEN